MAYLGIFRELVTQMMIDDQGLDTGIVYDWRRRTTALIHHNEILGTFGTHCLPLFLIMYAFPLSHEVDIYRRGFGTKSSKGSVYDNSRIEAICIFVRYDESLLFGCGACQSVSKVSFGESNVVIHDPYHSFMYCLATSIASREAGHSILPLSPFRV